MIVKPTACKKYGWHHLADSLDVNGTGSDGFPHPDLSMVRAQKFLGESKYLLRKLKKVQRWDIALYEHAKRRAARQSLSHT